MWRMMIFLLVLAETASSGFEIRHGGARAAALAGAAGAIRGSVWSIVHNPAGLSDLRYMSAGVAYAPQPFGIPELGRGAFVAAFPTALGTFGCLGSRSGFDLYREVTATLSFASSVSGFSVGFNVNYYNVSIARYGSAGAFGVDGGVQMRLMKNVEWGMAIHNLNAPTIGLSGEKLPQSFISGITYRPDPPISLLLEYRKETSFTGSARFGIEYWLMDAFAIRSGAGTEPDRFSGGVGLRFGLFNVDYAFTTHQELGGTHEASLTLEWGGDE